jgi:hypothetical protein
MCPLIGMSDPDSGHERTRPTQCIEIRGRLRSRSFESHHLHARPQGAERLPSRTGVQAYGRIVGIATGAQDAPSRHAIEERVMQGLSQAPASMFGENDKFDDLEVAANPLGGDPLWK